MSVKQFQACTYREFVLMMEGYSLRRTHDFEHTRAICYYQAAANWDTKKSPLPSIEKFWPLDTDEVKESKNDDYEYLKELMEKAKLNKLD